MKKKSLPRLIYLALCTAGAYQIFHFYPLLPDTVASHFGVGGQADGWSPKSHLVVMDAGVLIMLGGLFLGIGVLPRYTPASLLNLPNKNFWLAPERKEQTLRFYSDQIFWIGNATLLFLLYTMQRTFQANLSSAQKLDGDIWLALAAYLGLVTALSVGLCLRFRRPVSAVGTQLPSRSE